MTRKGMLGFCAASVFAIVVAGTSGFLLVILASFVMAVSQ
jgi:hypothetical protein